MEPQTRENHEYDPATGCLLRIFWMMIGNALLLFCAYGITQQHSSPLGIPDALYWALVGSLLAARYVDVRWFHGMTADGDRATMTHWRHYAMILGAVSMVVWLGAHAIAHYGAG